MNDATKSHIKEHDPTTTFKKKPKPFATSQLLMNDSGLVDDLTTTIVVAPRSSSSRKPQQKLSPPVILREKVVIIGDACCGKTCLVKSLKSIARNKDIGNNNHFVVNYEMTKCVELNVAEIPIPNTNICVDLFLHDMGGQPIFQKREFFQQLYWKNCTYFICCFDLTCRKSFESVKKWIGLIRSTAVVVMSSSPQEGEDSGADDGIGSDSSGKDHDSVPTILLVGTKKDLRDGKVGAEQGSIIVG